MTSSTSRELAALAGALVLGIAGHATAEDLSDTVRRQQEIIEALTRRIEQLEAQTAAAPTRPAVAAQPPAVLAAVQPPPPQLERQALAPLAPYTAKLRGRIHADAWAVNDWLGGTEFRRARIGVEGRVGVLPYVIEVDFAGNTASLQDVHFGFPLGGSTQLRLGYHKVPFSLDDQTSDNYNLFMEHPAGIDAFVPGRGVGAALLWRGERWFAHAGVFGEGESDARDGAGDENLTVGARLAWAPVLAEDRVVHLAVAGYRTSFQGAPTLRLRQRPERHLAQYVLDTGLIDADSLGSVGLEAAFTNGPFGMSAEATLVRVDVAGITPEYAGYSVEGWWTLTGEPRPYKMDGAVFDRIKPRRPLSAGGWGGWQLAVRYSQLDLNDSLLPAGKLSVMSLGLNWYAEDGARVMLNANRSSAIRPGGEIDQTGVGARFQVDF